MICDEKKRKQQTIHDKKNRKWKRSHISKRKVPMSCDKKRKWQTIHDEKKRKWQTSHDEKRGSGK